MPVNFLAALADRPGELRRVVRGRPRSGRRSERVRRYSPPPACLNECIDCTGIGGAEPAICIEQALLNTERPLQRFGDAPKDKITIQWS